MSTLRDQCLPYDFERFGIHHHPNPLMSTSSSSNSVDANEFTGKRVLVTGGTKGAGKAIADRFLWGGATVAITARSVPGEKTAAHFIQADVSTAEGAAKVIKEILNHFHGIDVIIHNVGGSSAPSGGYITVTDEIWQQNFNENLFPAVRLDRGLLPSMIERGSGVIITFRRFRDRCLCTIRHLPMRRRKQRLPTTARPFLTKSVPKEFGSSRFLPASSKRMLPRE